MTTTNKVPAVEMRDIVKRFGPLIANDQIDFTLGEGEIHALLGENGAGKTTLMRILYGLYRAEGGQIWRQGSLATIQSPKEAIALGIGMVTQHFALVPTLSVTENIIIGYTKKFCLNMAEAHEQVALASQHYGIEVEPKALVKALSVGQRQCVEILKALYRQAQVLILDEPTAVLVPQEIEQLFESLRQLKSQGLSVIFISHKLNEVMSLTDKVTVLRAGKVIGSVATTDTTQAELAQMMVEQETFAMPREIKTPQQQVVLRLEQITALDGKGLPALKAVTFEVHAGEILGLAGVSGNGQTELAQVLEGTRPSIAGKINMQGQDLTNCQPAAMMAAGIGRISEDRHASVVGDLSVAQNMALEHLDDFRRRGLLNQRALDQQAEKLIAAYQIKARPKDKIRTLSGGNMQKVILARVLERQPKVLVVAQPTRGLDVGATAYVRAKLLEQRARGAAILLISEDLDEILALSDRIAVIYEGQIRAILPSQGANMEQLGLLMSGAR